MGREATCDCTWPGGTGPVRALLEAHALILRGTLKRQIALASIVHSEAVGDDLCIADADGTIRLHLGARQAESWAAKLRAGPPTLREKLGLAGGAKAFLFGRADDAQLDVALATSLTVVPAEATMTIAVVTQASDLAAALGAHAGLPPGARIWIVHAKGKQPGVGETLVRDQLRAAGYRDTKVAAVSDRLTAIRFTPAPGA